ncbi:uncharacterized protein LOC104907867 [Beta vulgaris subsp. vulgaris]|uniref:uncharacterized protein LOC104907867 n=1 Tax=Beta vulgaris subsp. vulgaris TaxID=3555 RepID=UPI002036B18E|nr:uncharacterized protein LOC104907867 [Beta vulgaris subsp. vulgaris]XP_048500803.1 uncharacterized protein LOC104907867 [Beta vulgaris subsp. vulgaris]XP_048500804.1 uncharacterized protein LOC104907867 [Beta vulgaris subsp. vulgaris]XP_057251007.1 uncharacterized protein LOC104907867 [Beta vulgaris subsp. vulgaris]XP_057251008.1 uncharacterized protein LOC104907867 [Beta vulgaris subsp. vulgaris]
MSSSTSRKRPKSSAQNPNSSIISNHTHSPSSSSTLTSLLAEVEPPPNLLPSKSDFLKLFAVITIAALVGAFCNFSFNLFNRPPLSFCDSDVVEYDASIADSCEPCPSNGRCSKGKLECTQGYRKYGKLCIEDGDIYEAAKKLSGWTKDRLCEAHAQYMCDGTGAIWVSEDNLKNMLDKDGLFEVSTTDDMKSAYTKEKAMEDISGLLETRIVGNGVKEYKCPDVLAGNYKPIICRAQQWIAKNLLLLMAVFALLAGCTLLLLRIRRSWYLAKKAEHLYHQVCDTLEDNALMYRSMGDKEPWLIASRLRDHLLTPKERRDPLLWKMVEDLVESDSRLDRYPKLVKGESKVVWEWQVEGSLSSSRRKKEEIAA